MSMPPQVVTPTDRLDLPVALEVIERCLAARGFVFAGDLRPRQGDVFVRSGHHAATVRARSRPPESPA
jgi:hypothetical protein